jgi:GMP synthase-like glutamine amidotransferase
MNIHWIQHVSFEGLGLIEKWVARHGHALSCTRSFKEDPFPAMEDFELLIVMGGPMGVNDHESCPWLQAEKAFIREAVNSKKSILGICLGAQLLAQVLGAEVRPNEEKEIGWFPVHQTDTIPVRLKPVFPQEQNVFHWHGDTFALPTGAQRLYSSPACLNQAFLYDDRVLGLQFHLETTAEGVELLVANCSHEIVAAQWIQKEEDLRKDKYFEDNYLFLDEILKYLTSI